MRYCGTQIGDSDGRRYPQEDGLEDRDDALVRVGVKGIVNDPGLVGHVEDRRDAVVDECGPE
jgi:hypothetical protein